MLPLLVQGCSCATVQPGETGVLVHTRGSERGELETLGIGRHTIGVFDEVFTFPTNVQRVVWTESATEGSKTDEAFRIVSADQVKFITDAALSYQVASPDAAKRIFQKYRQPIQTLTDGFVRDAVRKAASSIAAQTRSDSLYGSGLEAYQIKVTNALKRRLEPEGFIVDEFSVVRIEPADAQMTQAIARRSAAKQEAIQKEEELRAAIAGSRADSVRAAASARNNAIMQASFTPQVLERMRLENERMMINKWNGQLPQAIMPGISPFATFSAPRQ